MPPVTRKQCKKCPWRKSTNPRDIPHGYCETAHAALRSTIAEQGVFQPGSIRMMACHATPRGREKPCVGWLAHQLGPGNNIALRLRARRDPSLADFALVGPQHERFEDTLPTRAD